MFNLAQNTGDAPGGWGPKHARKKTSRNLEMRRKGALTEARERIS